ncbi:MAG: cyclic dehypoxanthinyl futalosine synthase [Candidatus Caenarcaniphilales bacterium]|nr:cyclic dehypoxanthinyl futalosine synthase [Candidatus Caenarcaniphilales bacterium]
MTIATLNHKYILAKSVAGERISSEEALVLFREAPLIELGQAAQQVRYRQHPEPKVTFVIDRNINYTNSCTAACRFCAFAFYPGDERNYLLEYAVIKDKIKELVNEGGSQVLLQGGHNPDLGIEYYEDLFRQIKVDFPEVTLHALSPSEIDHIRLHDNLPLDQVIERLKAAGWDSLPGGGAEILVKRVRDILSPLKTDSETWLEVMRVAHRHGIQGSATMMFGHVETFAERIQHMERIRELQDQTGGFRAFISWTFQPGDTPLAKDSRLSEGEGSADGLDYLRTQAVSRLYLDNIPNIQASWVTQGFGIGQIALHYGANDFGGTMLEENVVSAAGSVCSKSNVKELVYQIQKAGFIPVQRDTFYNHLKEFAKD